MARAIDGRKICSACRVEFPTENFGSNRAQPDRLANQCKSCQDISRKKNFAKDPARFRSLQMKSARKNKYGITGAEHEAMLDRQGGVCATCGSPPRAPFVSLSVDHDHNTNRVRGLLCNLCNNALGAARDQPEVLRALANYLEKHGS
jgi:hypothetical protein